MTKSEHARLVAWRAKLLTAARDETRTVARRAGTSASRGKPSTSGRSGSTPTARRGSVIARARRIDRPGPRPGGRQQDSVPAPDVPLRPGQDRRLSEALSPDRACAVLRASHPGPARTEPVPGQSEASAHAKRWQRYEKPQPGHRLQIDVKFLGADPRHAEAALPVHRHRRLHPHPRAEDLRRVQPADGHPLHRRRACGACRFGFTSSRPTTVPSSSRTFTGTCDDLDIRHVYIRPRTPHLNGKVERSHRVDDQEFYQLLDKDGITDDIHLFNEKLREWEDYYNYHRPHGALDGQTPYERLIAKTRAGASTNS